MNGATPVLLTMYHMFDIQFSATNEYVYNSPIIIYYLMYKVLFPDSVADNDSAKANYAMANERKNLRMNQEKKLEVHSFARSSLLHDVTPVCIQ